MDDAPTPIVTGPTTGVRGQPLTFSLSGIDLLRAILVYSVNWGDGSGRQEFVALPGEAQQAAIHVYATANEFEAAPSRSD